MKIHRPYYTGDKLKYSFNREWAYFHVSKRCLNVESIHVCPDEFDDMNLAGKMLEDCGFKAD